MKKTILIILIITVLVILAGCEEAEKRHTEKLPPPNSCEVDEDCVCGGIDKATNNCFIGNKVYYDLNVDKTKQCPDFCTGIDGNMVIKCIDNKCQQTYECVMDFDCKPGQRCKNNRCFGKSTETEKEECSSDKDCITGGCSGIICQPRDAEPVFTTCEYKEEYSCYKDIKCGCVEGKCQWKKNREFELCIQEKRGLKTEGPA